MSVMAAKNAEQFPYSQGNCFRLQAGAIAEYIPQMNQPLPTDFQMRLRARLSELGLSYRAASLEAGLSPEAVGKMLKPGAGLPRGSNLAGLARALKTSEQWLLTGESPEESGTAPGSLRELTYADDEVEIKAVAAGSYEGAFQLSDNSIGHAPLPRGLRRYTGVYAIVIINDSMFPEHRPGDIRFATPTVKPKIGESVIVEFERDPDHGPEAMIGHLKQAGPTVRIGKLNPIGEVEIPANQIRRMHRLASGNEIAGL